MAKKQTIKHVLHLLSFSTLLYYLSTVNYLFFHTIIEVSCVTVTAGLAFLAYNTLDIEKNFFFTLLGISYGITGLFDFLHTITYKGMAIFPGISPDLSIQLWIIARLIDSSSLFLGIYFQDSIYKSKRSSLFIAYSIISVISLLVVFQGSFPICYIDGTGLTPFKIFAEYSIIGIFSISILLLKKKPALLPAPISILILHFAALSIAAEFCLTLYSDVYGDFNVFGHLFKLMSYFLLFSLLVKVTLKEPHKLLTEEFNQISKEVAIKNDQLALQEKRFTFMEEKISQLDKLHLVGEMAASIGHEIRNPLTTVRGFLQFFGKKPEFDRHKADFEIIISELDHANHIITEFLFLAKDRRLTLKTTTLNQIIEAVLPLAESNALLKSCQIDVVLDIAANLLLDEKLIRQLLLNLIKNGLEAMPNGGRLKLRTINNEETVQLILKDEGSGFPQHILENFGTPFLTTKPEGTGLGIAICCNIVNKHNAAIEVKSSPSGTEFSIYFPRCSAKQSAIN